MFWLIGILIIGLIAGALARLLVPGEDPMGLLGTLVLGLVGSVIGGFLGYLIFGADVDDGAVQAAGSRSDPPAECQLDPIPDLDRPLRWMSARTGTRLALWQRT